LRWLYDRRDLPEARRDLAAWLAKWSGKYSKLTGWIEENIDETLSFYRLTRQHHKHLKSTNMLERLTRRSGAAPHVVRIFPMARAVCGWCGRSPSRPTRTGSSSIVTSTWTICENSRRKRRAGRPDPFSLAPCSLALSRTLRGGSAGAAAVAAASLTAAAGGALPEGRSGRRDGRFPSNKRMLLY
jgi:Transposase, Mutator family